MPAVQLCLVLVRTPITNHLAALSSWRTICDEFLSSTSPAEVEVFISFKLRMECLLMSGLSLANPISQRMVGKLEGFVWTQWRALGRILRAGFWGGRGIPWYM